VQALLAERSAAYAKIEHHVDTTGKSIREVAEQVIAKYQAWLELEKQR
jgi:shikimate kinase